MSGRKLKPVDASQATISHVFSVAAKKAAIPKIECPAKVTETKGDKTLVSENPRVQAFYDSLSPREVIAHSIAVTKLGTSYDVTRTHGFLKWSKANPA
jgi:hypothetical protein